MRAHLINPPAANGVDMVREGRCMQRAGAWTAVWPPISLATIAAVLEADGVACRLDDCIIEGLDPAAIVARVRDFKPELVVINAATPSIVSDLALAAAIKREAPQAFIVAIGIHVTALPEESLKMAPALDGVVRGEPELTILELGSQLRGGRPLLGLSGLSLRDGGGFCHGLEREPADLDRLPLPAWGHVLRDRYRMPFSNRPFLLVGVARGCPHHCAFCADHAYYGHRLRLKSPDRIVAELRRARDEFNVREFLFWAESFTLRRDWTVATLEAIIKADLGVRFVINSRADHVDPELLALLKKAGGWMIGFGLESGSQRVLDLMNKKSVVEDGARAVTAAKQAGLMVTAHLVLGYPGETLETINQTIEYACSLPLDFAQFYCAVPFPGSRLYQEAKEKGWIQDPSWDRFEQNFAVISTPELSAEQVMDRRRAAYRRFYGNPRRIWRVIRDQVGLKGAPHFLKMALSFREWV